MRRALVVTRVPFSPEGSRSPTVPDHYFMGVSRLRELGYEPVFLSRNATVARLHSLRRLPARLGTRYGDLPMQLAALPASHDADILYDPWDIKGNALIPAALRTAGLLRKPLVAYVHGASLSEKPLWQRLAHELFYAGADALPAMSPSVVAELSRRAAWAPKTRLVRPGPDADYYTPASVPGRAIVSVGKSLRDFDILGRAATRTTARVRIVCPLSAVTPAFADFGSNVTVSTPPPRKLLPRRAIDPILHSALAVAIPLSTTRLMAGLWSFFDALGFGKAVLITRHAGIPVDIEREGIGRWVDVGDEQGWADTLQYFEDNIDEAFAMGQRARALVDSGLNSARFAEDMAQVFDEVLAAAGH